MILLKKLNNSKYKYVVNYEGKNIFFGANGYSDYTIYSKAEQNGEIKRGTAEKRKNSYIARHSSIKGRENWYDPSTKGFWSKHILWNKPTIKESIKDLEESGLLNPSNGDKKIKLIK